MIESQREQQEQRKPTESGAAKTKSKPVKMSLDEFQRFDPARAARQAEQKSAESEEAAARAIEASVEEALARERGAVPSDKLVAGGVEKHLYLQLKAELEKRDEQMASLTTVIISLKVRPTSSVRSSALTL